MSIVIDDTDLPKVAIAIALSPLPVSVMAMPGAFPYPDPLLVTAIDCITPALITGVPRTAVCPWKNCVPLPADDNDISVPLFALVLVVANLNWLNPEMTNLVPVLNSYWLMIHVAVIVGSYGPFTISMILGIVSLILMILVNKKNRELLNINVKELVLINEMSMTIGLVMLTIGNFLGGMWANESWGRYWGWDPKETWALISIMVYAFVIHMRLIPGLKSNFTFTVASILSFGSIIMTYFGVNFYLAGLHSYAKDDQEISLVFISITLAIILILSLLAYPKYKKYLKNNR